MTAERRRFDRVPHAVPLFWRRPEDRSERWSEAQTLNVSAGGLVMQSHALFDVGAILELRMALSDTSDPLFLRGRVVWYKPGGLRQYGIGFVDVTPDQQASIEELVQFLNKRVS